MLRTLVANHRRFLEFLERRTGSRAEAEDVLQAAFVRTLERGVELRSGESAVAWFYRVLRNALIDRARAGAARERAHAAVASEADEIDDPELHAEACRCVLDLLPTLKDDQARMLRRVDLERTPVQEVAGELGITPNAASVRLHRARQALLGEVRRSCRTCASHGCLDCTCGSRA